ncbi:MAG TPA: hypothetical protein VE553_06325 [Candidatus Binatia bacterium]|nr:hypothetical protein [Candidatus Binatia bacterium]
MDEKLEEMKVILQTLALPVIGQVTLLKEDCTRVALLAGAFDAAHQALQAGGVESLSMAQYGALERLDRQLTAVGRPARSSVCSELSMRQSPEWQEVRTTARETLIRFEWRLEIPATISPLVRAMPGTIGRSRFASMR